VTDSRGVPPPARRLLVSFNRPYAASTNPAASFGMGAGEFLCNVQPVSSGYRISSAGWDYNLVRWLEREGYYVTYVTNVDTQNLPELFDRRVCSSAGRMTNIGLGKAEPISNGLCPAAQIYFSPEPMQYNILARAQKGMDKAAPIVISRSARKKLVSWTRSFSTMTLPPSRRRHRCFRRGSLMFANTGLINGFKVPGLLGYEVDGLSGNAPRGLRVLAASPAKNLKDPSRTVVSNMAAYLVPSGAEVFATVQWSSGLSDFNAPRLRTSRLNPAATQITRNVFERFGAKRHSTHRRA
jgi:hypothetical protein